MSDHNSHNESNTTTSNTVGGEKAQKYHELEEQIRELSVKLREAEKGKSDFLSNVRNEINNPLTSILGLTARMIESEKDEKRNKLARLVHQEVFELDYQIRNILAAGEVEAGEVKLLPSHVNIPELIETQIQYLQPRTEAKNVTIQLISDNASDKLFYTDASLLQVIIINLLANAVEFSSRDSKTLIRSTIEDGKLCIQVEDFGEGIEASNKARIFERFHQLDEGSTKVHRGQGLGLAIVVEFVGMLNGDIACDSQEKIGTTITINLPELLADTPGATSFGNEILFNEGDEF